MSVRFSSSRWSCVGISIFFCISLVLFWYLHFLPLLPGACVGVLRCGYVAKASVLLQGHVPKASAHLQGHVPKASALLQGHVPKVSAHL